MNPPEPPHPLNSSSQNAVRIAPPPDGLEQHITPSPEQRIGWSFDVRKTGQPELVEPRNFADVN
jgi:hypothetical protein